MTYISTGPCTPRKHKEITQICDRCKTARVCENCKYIIDDLEVCEKCQNEIHEEAYERDGICPNCGNECEPIYENNGFTEPNGPSHWEITGWKPCQECNQSDYNGDEDL